MLEKKMFKVLSPMQKHEGGGTWWMRVGSGYESKNKAGSINLYLDAVPCQGGPVRLLICEMDESDLQKRGAAHNGPLLGTTASAPSPASGSSTPQGIPF